MINMLCPLSKRLNEVISTSFKKKKKCMQDITYPWLYFIHVRQDMFVLSTAFLDEVQCSHYFLFNT